MNITGLEYTHTILQNLQNFKPNLPKSDIFVNYDDIYVYSVM